MSKNNKLTKDVFFRIKYEKAPLNFNLYQKVVGYTRHVAFQAFRILFSQVFDSPGMACRRGFPSGR